MQFENLAGLGHSFCKESLCWLRGHFVGSWRYSRKTICAPNLCRDFWLLHQASCIGLQNGSVLPGWSDVLCFLHKSSRHFVRPCKAWIAMQIYLGYLWRYRIIDGSWTIRGALGAHSAPHHFVGLMWWHPFINNLGRTILLIALLWYRHSGHQQMQEHRCISALLWRNPAAGGLGQEYQQGKARPHETEGRDQARIASTQNWPCRRATEVDREVFDKRTAG